MSNVIEFHRPKAKPKPPAPTFNVNDRREWILAVKAFWAEPANWKVSRRGNKYIVINKIGICAVIERRDDGYWSWEIRWQDGREPHSSNWTYVGEQIAIDEALDAVLVLA